MSVFQCNFKRKWSLWQIIMLVMLTLGANVFAQTQRTVSGIVTDTNNDPLIGVSVMVKGTTNGGMTDLDGAYSLKGVGDNATLVFSYIGHVTQEIKLGDRTKLDIVLKEDSRTLDEVVVVGYGTQKKVNLSGSVDAIKMDELIESRPISNISQGLAGLAAGVQVTSGSNRPGENNASIMIRGQGTLNNSAPLVIIDGIEGNFNSVNPQDIEDLSVLKDAASASIYGSKAANGVILITTKKGKSGNVKIDYNGYVSWESVGKTFDLVSNYADYMGLINEGYTNSGQPARFSQDKIDEWRAGTDALKYPNTDLMKEMFSTSVGTNHNLSVSGGSDKTTFYASFGYLDTPGVMEKAGFKKYSARANVETKVQPWLKLGVNTNGYVGFTEPGTNQVKDIFTFAAATTPGMVLRAPDGRYGGMNNDKGDAQAANNNPLYRLNNISGDIERRNLKTRFYGIINPLEGLTIMGSYNYEFTNKTDDSKPVSVPLWNFYNETVDPKIVRTSIRNKDEKWFRYLMDATVNYTRDISKLNFSIMGGASQELFRYKWFQTSRQDLLDPGLGTIDGATGQSTSSGNTVEWAMRSFFGRLNMNWDNKYLFEFNLRADGSSRFTKDQRWGYFPSASAAWRMDQEAFMAPLSSTWLSNMKLRLSYGVLGNNVLDTDNPDTGGNYMSQATYDPAHYILNNILAMGVAQKGIPNPLLTWESTKIADVGIDFGFLNNRLTSTIDYFHKTTEDILINLPAPLVNGNATIPRQNAATVVNQGLEITAGWNDKIGDVTYYASGNVTFLKNEVTKFKGDEATISGANMIKEGHPINTQYVRIVDRLVQTQADLDYVKSIIDNAPVDASGKKRDPFSGKTPQLGDLLYKDLNGDGIINDEDRTAIGNGSNPKFTFGMNLGAAWKGIDFSILMQGATGMKVYWNDNYFRPSVRTGYQINQKIADGRWYQGREGDASYPRLLEYSDDRNTKASDFWLQNKSYFKIRNIQLGYSLPKEWITKAGLEKLRIYGSLENFFTFTSYDGLDPEVSGVTYPAMKQAVIGVNVSF